MKEKAVKHKPFKMKISPSRVVFVTGNTIFLAVMTIICIFPFINLLAISLSSSNAVAAGVVTFWPKDITLNAYRYLLNKRAFFVAFGISLARVALTTVLSLVVMILAAYPMAQAKKNRIHGKNIYVVLFIVCMFFSGGLIPTYIVIVNLGLYNSIWALVLPATMNCWNLVLLINFFKRVPQDLLEYAALEGAGHLRILFQIVVPVSIPAIATVVLFTAVNSWNAWFDGYIYMSSERYPLQTYIYDLLETLKTLQASQNKTPEDLELLRSLGDTTIRSAQVFIAMVPIMLVYPFAQKHFVKGLLLGSVKE